MIRARAAYLIVVGLIACNGGVDQGAANKPATDGQKIEQLNKLKLNFGSPVLMDSSTYVMYPLILKDDDGTGGSFSSSGRATSYWNFVFYNTATGEYHLLSDSLKMLIYSYHFGMGSVASSSGSSYSGYIDGPVEAGLARVGSFLYYRIIVSDYNKDGKLDHQDPTYLFVSDKEGRRFRQVSPGNMDLKSWDAVRSSNSVLMLVAGDDNGDGKFDDRDRSIPFVYNLSGRTTPNEVFKDTFNLRLKKMFDAQWGRK